VISSDRATTVRKGWWREGDEMPTVVRLPRLRLVRRRDLSDRLDPESRAAAVYVFGRCAIAVTSVIMLGFAAASDGGDSLGPALLVHVGFALSAVLVALVVLAAGDAARPRWVRGLLTTDVVAYAAYSVVFGAVPGAGSLAPVFVLLAGPLLLGWRGLLVTAVPVGVVASVWPQTDALGQTAGVWEVWVLVLLLTVPAAAVSTLVRRGSVRLARAEEQFRTAFDDASSGMALLDDAGRVLRANPALHALLGVDQLTGMHLRDFTSDQDQLRAGLARLSVDQRASRFELGLHAADGEQRWVSVVASAICDDGRVQRIILQAEDVSQQRRLQDQLSFEATHDSLTGLPNHRVLHDRLAQALEQRRPVAVLFVDLDRFKLINDSLGHIAGDRLLVAASERLQRCMRPEDLVARLGGDEFVVLCLGPSGGDLDAAGVAQRVLLALRPAFPTADGVLSVRGSVGVAVAADGASAETLIRDADTAMYAAKTGGGNRAVVFTDELRADVVRRQELEGGLRDAVRDGSVPLAYQPIVDEAGRIVGAEALLRWDFDGEPVDPAEAVAIAEQSDLIAELGMLVLRRALQDSAGWPADVRLHVNLSAHQLDDEFPTALRALLDQTRPAPGRLCLELTETAVRDDLEGLVGRLEQIRALGVRLAIDDFGVGNASLTYLARLPVQDLKIDRSFVSGLPQDGGSVAIVSGVVAMARAYGLQIVAEGVETREQDLACVRLGCTRRQGFLHHRPMSVGALQGLWAEDSTGARVPQQRAGAEAVVRVVEA
jgi:diguanylate cyclase (GGDEF)-like protein/PAS domain S-box-containing protein